MIIMFFCIFQSNSLSESEFLLQQTKILCWIILDGNTKANKFSSDLYHPEGYPMPSIYSPETAITRSWGKRCSKLLIFAPSLHNSYHTPVIRLATKTVSPTWTSAREALIYISQTYIDEYHWFLQAEEDTYVIMENLAYYLSVYNSSQSINLGHAHTSWSGTYASAGSGSVLSQGAMRRLYNKLLKGHCEPYSGSVNSHLGNCLSELGVQVQDTRDYWGRARFLEYQPSSLLLPNQLPWHSEFVSHSKYISPQVGN